MSRIIVDAVRNSSASSDGITLASDGSVTIPGNATCSGTATGFGGGKLLQCVQTVKTDHYSVTNTAVSDITGINVTCTTDSSNSKVLILVELAVGDDGNGYSGFKLIRGSTNILVASIQCAGTGIDGLQAICNKAIFFQLPWTSTEFEQSIGRLDRDGTEFDSVEVILPVTYLELPNGDIWSWCESKLERIRSKKDIAKAAVDGDLPDSGAILSPQEATTLWLKWLKRLENSPND